MPNTTHKGGANTPPQKETLKKYLNRVQLELYQRYVELQTIHDKNADTLDTGIEMDIVEGKLKLISEIIELCEERKRY